MFADIVSKFSRVEVWVPLTVAMATGAICIVMYRTFGKRPPLPAPAPPTPCSKKEPEYDPFVEGSATEQRYAHRRAGNPVEVLLAPEGSTTQQWRGWVLDRSVCGLCLCVPDEFADGTVLRALPVKAPKITPWTDLEVRSCRGVKDGYEIGCQFIRQPPWSVLLLFG
jgi:hypothetical protein